MNKILYTCEKCNKEFKQKCHYMNHMLRKYACNNKTKNKTALFNCKFCDHSFNRNQHLIRHLKICKMNKNIDCDNVSISDNNNSVLSESSDGSDYSASSCNNNKINNNRDNNGNKIYYNKNIHKNITKTEYLELKKKLENIENLIIDNKPNVLCTEPKMINIENQTVNITNNIYIVNYKDEKLDDSDMNAILTNDDPILYAVEKIHCNEDNPEQHNVLINDKTRNNIYVYENEKWNIKNKSQTLNNIYSSTIKKIADKITNKDNDIIEVVNSNIPDKYNNVSTDKFIDERNYFYKNPKNMKKTTTRMNEMIYNNKNKIVESKNKNDLFVKKKNKIIQINKNIKKELVDNNENEKQ